MSVSKEQMAELFKFILGSEQYDPNGSKAVSYEQNTGGMNEDQFHDKKSSWLKYANDKHNLINFLEQMGYSLDDMGFQDKKELGKSAFDQDSWAASNGFRPNNYEYNWATGMKHNVVTSDATAMNRWEPITEQEKQLHSDAQRYSAMGYKTYAEQQWARQNEKMGRSLEGGMKPVYDLNFERLKERTAHRFGTEYEAGAGNGIAAAPGESVSLDPVHKPVDLGSTRTWSDVGISDDSSQQNQPLARSFDMPGSDSLNTDNRLKNTASTGYPGTNKQKSIFGGAY